MYSSYYVAFFCFFLSGTLQSDNGRNGHYNRNSLYVFLSIVGGVIGCYSLHYLKKKYDEKNKKDDFTKRINDFTKRIKENAHEKEFIIFTPDVYDEVQKDEETEATPEGFFFVRYNREEQKWFCRKFNYKDFPYGEDVRIRLYLKMKFLSEEGAQQEGKTLTEKGDTETFILFNNKKYLKLLIYSEFMDSDEYKFCTSLYSSEENREEEITEEKIKNSFYSGLVFSTGAESYRSLFTSKMCYICSVFQEVPMVKSSWYKIVYSFPKIFYDDQLKVDIYHRFFYPLLKKQALFTQDDSNNRFYRGPSGGGGGGGGDGGARGDDITFPSVNNQRRGARHDGSSDKKDQSSNNVANNNGKDTEKKSNDQAIVYSNDVMHYSGNEEDHNNNPTTTLRKPVDVGAQKLI